MRNNKGIDDNGADVLNSSLAIESEGFLKEVVAGSMEGYEIRPRKWK